MAKSLSATLSRLQCPRVHFSASRICHPLNVSLCSMGTGFLLEWSSFTDQPPHPGSPDQGNVSSSSPGQGQGQGAGRVREQGAGRGGREQRAGSSEARDWVGRGGGRGQRTEGREQGAGAGAEARQEI